MKMVPKVLEDKRHYHEYTDVKLGASPNASQQNSTLELQVPEFLKHKGASPCNMSSTALSAG